MSTVAHFSLDEYEHMANVGAFAGKFHRRVELIRGEIVDMTPIGVQHANCVTRLMEWSFEVVPLDRIMIRTQNPLRLPACESEPEPDILWVTRRDYDQNPGPNDVLLVIEAADSSLDFDRTDKLAIYAESGIPDYWIVNLVDDRVEVYRKPRGRGYEEQAVYRGDAAIHPLALPAATLQPARLFG